MTPNKTLDVLIDEAREEYTKLCETPTYNGGFEGPYYLHDEELSWKWVEQQLTQAFHAGEASARKENAEEDVFEIGFQAGLTCGRVEAARKGDTENKGGMFVCNTDAEYSDV